MKKEVKLLRQKAIQSLILSIEIFNRPSDAGRIDGVLIFLDHAFEMLLKSIILHRKQLERRFSASSFGHIRTAPLHTSTSWSEFIP